MTLEEKLLKTAKFVATGTVGTVMLMATGYGLGALLQGTYADTSLQGLFHTFKAEYHDLGTLLSFTGFGTGLKMTALKEFYNAYPKIKKAYLKIKDFTKKIYNKVDCKRKNLEIKLKKPSFFKGLGKYFIAAGVGLGLGKVVGECFEYIPYTNQAFTYLFNNFASIHFKTLGDLFTLLGMIWGFRFKPQLEDLYIYTTDRERYRSERNNNKDKKI